MLRRILIVLTLPFIGLMNYLAQNQYFGEKLIEDTADIAGAIATPAGWAFSIRGIIYLGVVAYCGYIFLSKRKNDPVIQKINPRVFFLLVLNGSRYLFATIQGAVRMSAILIVLMRVALGMICKHLAGFEKDWKDRLFVAVPMFIHFAWITVAAPLNVAGALTDLGYTRAVINPLAVLSWILISRITAIVVFRKTQRMSYVAVIIRTLIAVMSVRYYDNMVVFRSAGGLMILTFVVIISRLSKTKKLVW